MHSSCRWKNRTCLCGTANYAVSCKPVQAENRNLRKSGSAFHHGTVFAPKQCIYQKETTEMESPKMQSSSRFKNRTDQFGTATYPVSCKLVYSRVRKFAEIRVYFSLWYHGCTKALFISKGSYVYGESKNAILQSVQKPRGTANYQSHVSQYTTEYGNLPKFGSTFRHGTVFALKQCLYQKEATGMESPNMHSSTRCKNQTYLCGTANYPVSYKPVQGRERKFVEIQVYLSPRYRVCTKAMIISKGSYRYGESKNAFLQSVQKPHLPVRDGKLPRLR